MIPMGMVFAVAMELALMMWMCVDKLWLQGVILIYRKLHRLMWVFVVMDVMRMR